MESIIRKALRTFSLLVALCATGGAWAVVPTPVAVWDGNFSTTKVNGWTLNANGNTVASDKSTITITSKGFTITPTTAVAPGTGVTVLVKMSGVSQNANNDQILVCAKQSDQNVMTGTSLCAGAMTLHGAWLGAAKWNNANNAETTFSVPSSGEFYILFANGDANGYVREGVYANGTINTKEISGLRASGTGYDVGMITIGGRPASDSEKASNAVISRVMIYEGNLTQQQMKDAIDDMETTKSYSLHCQAATNKGGLNWANFQLPYSTHYAESGSASLNTDKALRQITIPWRPDGTVNGSGATSLFLGITDSSGKLLALSSGADMSTVTTTSSSTFDFSQAYLSAGTQYRYWFLNSDSYSLGDTITEGIQMGCALYYLGSNVSQMQSSTMTAYCPAARYWCSNMTESEFTATAGGTAVSTSGAYADDITLKGVADGKFTLGGALNAARITLADAAATIEMDSGDSIKAQYLDNSTQKLVIDASNGATAVGTYTLFEGNLASVADANLEVTFPSLGSGYELYTTKTANKISYQVDRTAVNATLTLTANCSFSEVKYSMDNEWIDSNHSTLEIVNNQESPITLTFDENITAGSITVSGTGTTIIESSNSAVITAGTVTIPSGATFDATGASITTCAGAGTFIWTAGYPATVPAGATYRYVGSNDSANPVAIAGVTVTGTLKTSGYTSLTSLVIDAAGTLDVLSESTSVTTTYRSNGAGNLSGTIVVESGATLVNGGTDTLDWAGSPTVDVYGTLAMGTTRWSVPGGCTFNLRAGAQVTGAGDSLASLDFINGASKGLDVYGSARVEGKVRVRVDETRIWIAENSTLVLANGIADGGGHTGGFKQVGPGTLEIHANSTGLSGSASIMTQGTLRLADTTLAFPVELQGNYSYLEVVATEAATVVPVNIASIANNNVTFSGAGKVNGTITKTSAPSGNLATALQSSAWTGTFVADWAGANGTRFDINSYGNANSVVEVTKLAGGYVSGSNANVTVVPTVKVSGTMTLDNGYSGKVTTFTKLTGSGTVTFNTYTCDITTLDNFTGTLKPTDSYGTGIGTINLTSAPAFGAKVVTLGTGANIRSIGNTSVSVNGVVDNTIALAVVAGDGIYRAEAAYNGVNYTTLAAAVSEAATASADPSAVTVYNSSATVPSGYAIVTAAGGAMTLRSAGNGELIYWASGNSGDWSGENSNGTHTFYTAAGGTSTTPYVSGDTVVFTSDTQIWSKTAAHGAKFQIGTDSAQAEVHFTRSGSGCDNYILDESTVEVKSGSVLVVERYSDTNPPTQAYTEWDSYQNDNPDESAINDTVISGAGTVKIGGNTGGHGAVAAVLSGTSTIANTVTIEFADGATLSVPSISAFGGSGAITLDVSDVTHNVAGVTLITFTDTIPSDASKFSCAAVLAIEDDDLVAYPAAATAVDYTTGKVTGYGTLQGAVDAAAADSTGYTYVVAYADGEASTSVNSILFKPNGYDAVLSSAFAGYAYTQGYPIPGIDGLYQYNSTPAAATFVWNGGASGAWNTVANWTSESGSVQAAPNNALYTISFGSNASVTLNTGVSVSGINVSSEVSIIHANQTEPTISVGDGGVVLTSKSATLTVSSDVTLTGTLTPSASLAAGGAKVKAFSNGDGSTTYKVVYGTIFSVY